MAARVRSWLRDLGRPASSARVMEHFLRMAPLPEPQATRLLSPTLLPEGLIYVPGEGWSAGPAPAPASGGPRKVAAVPDPRRRTVVLAEGDGRGGAGLVDAGGLDPSGTVLVVPDRRRDAGPVQVWLRSQGLAPLQVTGLRAAVRGAARMPRDADLPAIAEALGVRWHEGDDPKDVALAMAACLERAGALKPGHQMQDRGDAQGAPCRIPADQLAALPRAPGTYRFYDDAGGLLYVGKAQDLRRRVLSYLRPGRRPGHGDRFLGRAARVEVCVEGSELEALLAEARLIARRSPDGNVQRAVHEREARYGAARAWALLLPAAGSGAVSVVAVRDGSCLGHVAVGPRGGRLREAARLLEQAIASRPPRAAPGRARDSAILASWMARHADQVSRLELDTFRTRQDAMAALRAALRGLRDDPPGTVYRG